MDNNNLEILDKSLMGIIYETIKPTTIFED